MPRAAPCLSFFCAGGLFLLGAGAPVLGQVNSSASTAPSSVAAVDPRTEVQKQFHPYSLELTPNHLLGDWGGLMTQMTKAGITPTLNYISNFAGNPSGGQSQGFSYCDTLSLSLDFDLHQIAGVEGGSFFVSASQVDGTSLSQTRVGNVFPIQEAYGGPSTIYLVALAYTQELLDGRLQISAGRLATGDDFLVSDYNYLFMQDGFNGNPIGIFFNAPGMTAEPNATWGARIKVKPSRRTYIKAGVYNGDPAIRSVGEHGADFSMNGPLFLIAEAGYIHNGLQGDSLYYGDYKLGFWYDRSTYTDYATVGYAGAPGTKQDNLGIYGLFDQVVLPYGQPGSNRGLGVFGSALISPDQSVSQMPYFCTAGVAARGLWADRPRDMAGFGIVLGEFSDDLRASEQRQQLLGLPVGIQTHETALEWTYRFSIHKGAAFIQPDIQYILRPGGTGQLPNATVLGCQVGVNF
jgi:porin